MTPMCLLSFKIWVCTQKLPSYEIFFLITWFDGLTMANQWQCRPSWMKIFPPLEFFRLCTWVFSGHPSQLSSKFQLSTFSRLNPNAPGLNICAFFYIWVVSELTRLCYLIVAYIPWGSSIGRRECGHSIHCYHSCGREIRAVKFCGEN